MLSYFVGWKLNFLMKNYISQLVALKLDYGCEHKESSDDVERLWDFLIEKATLDSFRTKS